MAFLLDFLPIALFFCAYKFIDIYAATVTAIVATFILLLWSKWRTKQYQKTHVISFLIILFLGGTTLILHDDIFIKWKTTAVYWIFSIIFFGSIILKKKSIMKYLTSSSSIQLPNKVWRQLDLSWATFFLLLGCANLYVVYNFSTDTWVNFKLFGTLGLTFTFITCQCIYMFKFIQDNKE